MNRLTAFTVITMTIILCFFVACLYSFQTYRIMVLNGYCQQPMMGTANVIWQKCK